MDLIYVAVIVLFLLATLALVRGCDLLERRK